MIIAITIALTVGYVAIVFLAFKVIKIKFGRVSIPAAALIGLFLMTLTTVSWKMSAPMSDQILLSRDILIISPDVQEKVSKVHVKSNDMVKKGDPLFEVRPDRFQDALDQATAALDAAKSTVSQLDADVVATQAAVKQQVDETAIAKAQLDTAEAVHKSNPAAISKLKLEEVRQTYRADQAGDKVQEAVLKQATFSLAAAKNSVDVAQAAYDLAKFNLERCTYTSTVDGQVINFQITEGTPAARLRLSSIGTVQDLSNTVVVAILPQNLLKNVKAGNVAEIAFKSRPGQIATGKVDVVVNYTGEGQFVPSLLLPIAANVGSEGYLAVRITLDDEDLARQLPLGAAGAVAIYTDSGKLLHVMSKISLRMKSWLNYAPM
jgi:multidrug resistance efflux pump